MNTESLKIKICGLSREVDADYVNEAMPDFAGFVFAKSRRQVTFEQANRLKNLLKTSIKTVGVFVNHSLEEIIALCEAKVIDMIQLHGEEDENFIKNLKAKTQVSVIKALKAQSQEQIKEQSSTSADYILLDSVKNGVFGGTGEAFDWRIIPELKQPLFLAGGINLENVHEVIKVVKPFCIDVSSGVETDGVKDRKKIIEITKLIRGLKI